jgi:hypothetical protein
MSKPTNADARAPSQSESRTCQSIEWYSEGQARIVQADGVRITIRFVGRRGRRARIAITAPPGAALFGAERHTDDLAPDCREREGRMSK